MKKNLFFALVILIFSACGFQQRKYTRGYFYGQQKEIVADKSPEIREITKPMETMTETFKAPANAESSVIVDGFMESDLFESTMDTIQPDTSSHSTESWEGDSVIDQKESNSDEIPFDPYREELEKTVKSTYSWLVIAILTSFLYIGVFFFIYLFFKSLKTRRRIMELDYDGRYADLLKKIHVPLVCSSIVMGLIALLVLISILSAVLQF